MRRLVYIDCETTGTSPYTDRIVEIALIKAGGERFVTRVNPGVPIPMAAELVHGITDSDVADAPPFSMIAQQVQDWLTGAVLVGYNCRTFDTVLIDAELQRAGMPGLPKDSAGRIVAPEIDLYQLWQRNEDRKLATAVRRFAGIDLADAHAASADAAVLPEVLRGMCHSFGLDAGDVEGLCAMSIPPGAIDRDNRFTRDDEGVVRFTFGKHRGEAATSQPSFLAWMLRADFSPETKSVARALLRRVERASA